MTSPPAPLLVGERRIGPETPPSLPPLSKEGRGDRNGVGGLGLLPDWGGCKISIAFLATVSNSSQRFKLCKIDPQALINLATKSGRLIASKPFTDC